MNQPGAFPLAVETGLEDDPALIRTSKTLFLARVPILTWSPFPPVSPVTTHPQVQTPWGGGRGCCQGLRASLSNVDSDVEPGG